MAAAVDPDILKTVRAYVQVLRAHRAHFESIWLFGSFAENRAVQDSDIDIAVIMPDVQSKFYKEVELTRLRRTIDSRIEPHVISEDELDSPFFKEIQKHGVKVA